MSLSVKILTSAYIHVNSFEEKKGKKTENLSIYFFFSFFVCMYTSD